MGPNGADELSRILKTLPSLSLLNICKLNVITSLANNKIGAIGGKAIALSLKDSIVLNVLNISIYEIIIF